MKKLLFVLLSVILTAGLSYADATYTSTTNAKGGNADYGYGAAVDQTNGYTQHIDSEGAGYVQEKVSEVVEGIDSNDLYSGLTVKSGASRLNTIVFGGPSSVAGDFLLVYDNTSATGTPKFDVSVGTAKSTVVLSIPGGVKMATGIFAKVNGASSGSVATFAYDD